MAVNIKLCENWRLKSDAHNWIIVKEDGDRESHEGFYSSLEAAAKGFISMRIRGFNSSSLLGLLNSIKSLEKALHKALRTFNLPDVPEDVPKTKDIPQECKNG